MTGKRSICMNHNYIEDVGDGVGAHEYGNSQVYNCQVVWWSGYLKFVS